MRMVNWKREEERLAKLTETERVWERIRWLDEHGAVSLVGFTVDRDWLRGVLTELEDLKRERAEQDERT